MLFRSSNYDTVVHNKRVDLYQILELKAALLPNYDTDILDSPWLMRQGDPPLPGFMLFRCYEYLCVYTKVKDGI